MIFCPNFGLQDYEQQVAGVGHLVAKLSTETTNSTNDLETRLQVQMMTIIIILIMIMIIMLMMIITMIYFFEAFQFPDCSWKPYGIFGPDPVGEGGRGESVKWVANIFGGK